MSNRCMGSLFGGHNFQPRFNLGPVDISKWLPETQIMYGDRVEVLDRMRTKTYIHDICTRCGAISREVKHD